MSTSQFDNPVADHDLQLMLESDVNSLLRVLELFALRGVLPRRIEFVAEDEPALPCRLQVRARMGSHDWHVLCARAGTLIGVVELSDGTPQDEQASEAGLV